MREAQLEMREYSAHNAFLITKVLKSSSSAVDREAAAELLGYADQSERQIKALAAACFDSESEVRNNAMRALAVLAFSSPSKATNIATKTPLVRFMEMFNLLTGRIVTRLSPFLALLQRLEILIYLHSCV